MSIVTFAVLIYFRRHAKPSLAVVFTFFNIGIFAVVLVIKGADLSTPAAFGLFGILSIMRLRSDAFSPREISYFFGALVLGLINSLAEPQLLTVVLNATIVGAMYVLDHPRLFPVTRAIDVTFDRVVADPEELRVALEHRLGAPVGEVSVCSVDYVRDLMDLKVRYLPTDRPLPPRRQRTRGRRHDLGYGLFAPEADQARIRDDRIEDDEEFTDVEEFVEVEEFVGVDRWPELPNANGTVNGISVGSRREQ